MRRHAQNTNIKLNVQMARNERTSRSWFYSSFIVTVLDNLNRNFITNWIPVNCHRNTPNHSLAIDQVPVRLVPRNSERYYYQRCLDRFLLRATFIHIPQRITVKFSGASTVARGSRVHYLAGQTDCSHKERQTDEKKSTVLIFLQEALGVTTATYWYWSTWRHHSYLLISVTDRKITKQRVSTKIWSSSGHF